MAQGLSHCRSRDPSGKVGATVVDGSIDNAEIRTCLANIVTTTFEFRATDGSIQVHYP